MTRVLISIVKRDVYVEIENHAGDREVCGIISAYTNMLVAICRENRIEPETYESGHVKIYISDAHKSLVRVFIAAKKLFEATAEAYPEHIKVY